MRRMQIYLTEEQGRVLEGRSRATGRTISELIRDAIDTTYTRGRVMSQAERIRLAQDVGYLDRVCGNRRRVRRANPWPSPSCSAA